MFIKSYVVNSFQVVENISKIENFVIKLKFLDNYFFVFLVKLSIYLSIQSACHLYEYKILR